MVSRISTNLYQGKIISASVDLLMFAHVFGAQDLLSVCACFCVCVCVCVHAYVCVQCWCVWVCACGCVCTMSVRCGHVLPACLTSCNLLISALVSACMVARKLSKYTTFAHSCKPPLFCYCTFNISFLHQCSRLTPYCFVPPVHILS